MDRIGEYLVKRLVGEGGMGKVYEAEERLSKRRVALKVLRPELTRNDEGRRLFLNEMQILAHLEHANIVRSLASMEVDGQLVMALEFLEGRTLRQELVARGSLPWPEAVQIVVMIAEALAVAHGQQPPIIHRDLKPENVMITGAAAQPDGTSAPSQRRPPQIKVMDFGIAKVLEAVHATNTQSIGTLQYMSPEQIDAHTIDTRSDLYSLGLVFYEMLAGRPPFRSASPRELLNMQCATPPPELDDEQRHGLPRGVESVLYAMLEKAPKDRPASAADVVEKLAPFQSAASASSRAASPPQGLVKGLGGSLASYAGAGTKSPVEKATARHEASVISADTMQAGAAGAKAAEGGARSPRTDTIALVENATTPKHIPTALALLLIVGLSLLAGLTTYVIRMRAPSSPEPAVTASTLEPQRDLPSR
jgi:serine/threonine protein kinase